MQKLKGTIVNYSGDLQQRIINARTILGYRMASIKLIFSVIRKRKSARD